VCSPISKARCSSFPKDFFSVRLTKDAQKEVKHNLKTKHSKAHIEPISRTETDTPVLSLMLLVAGI